MSFFQQWFQKLQLTPLNKFNKRIHCQVCTDTSVGRCNMKYLTMIQFYLIVWCSTVFQLFCCVPLISYQFFCYIYSVISQTDANADSENLGVKKSSQYNNTIVFCMTRPGIEPMTARTRGSCTGSTIVGQTIVRDKLFLGTDKA